MSTLKIIVLPKNLSAPEVDAGPDITLYLPENSTVITAIATDEGTIVAYEWTQISGPPAVLSGANTATLSLNGLSVGIHTFQIQVTDDDDLTGVDTVNVTVIDPNIPPVSVAGPDQVVDISEYLTELDPLWTPSVNGAGYRFKTTIPFATTINQIYTSGGNNGIAIRVTELKFNTVHIGQIVSVEQATGHLTISFQDGFNPATVIHNTSLGSQSVLQLTFRNRHAIVNGGDSYDTDGTIVSNTWTLISGPGTISIETPTTLQTRIFEIDTPGQYNLNLQVTDDDSLSDVDGVTLNAMNNIALNPPSIVAIGTLKDSSSTNMGELFFDGNIETDGHNTPYNFEVRISHINNKTVDTNFKLKRVSSPTLIVNNTQQLLTGNGIVTFSIPGPLVVGTFNHPVLYQFEITSTDIDGQVDYHSVIIGLYNTETSDQALIEVLSTTNGDCTSVRVVRVTPPVGQSRTIEFSTASQGPPDYNMSLGNGIIVPTPGVINSSTEYTITLYGSNTSGILSYTETGIIVVKNGALTEGSNTLTRIHNGTPC